jgi:PIN domain nuclease of toxin-antitoxin system
MTYLDTHVVAWLYAGELSHIPNSIKRVINDDDLIISPIVILELQYLFEIGRVRRTGMKVVRELVDALGLIIDDLSFEAAIRHAIEQTWTRDPFDRIIVGQAEARTEKLVTKDSVIHNHYKNSLW